MPSLAAVVHGSTIVHVFHSDIRIADIWYI